MRAMKMLKYWYYCAMIVWKERGCRDVRAKRRRIAREFEKLARRFV